jgi:hypothetical protein
MRKRFSDIKNSKVFTSEDSGLCSVGEVTDLLIEDGSWGIRYLVVATHSPLPRNVLVSPAAIHGFDFPSKSIATMLTAHQIAESPPLESDLPISRQYEQALVDYYGWPIYWFGRVLMNPQSLDAFANNTATSGIDDHAPSNLRSANEICKYQIESNGGSAGVMKDLVIQMNSWTVDYATADARSWLPRESSMFSTKWISHVDWSNRRVEVDLTETVLEPVSARSNTPAIAGEPWSSQPFRTT